MVKPLSLILCLILSFSLQAKDKVISMRSDIWCPYACDPKSDHPGFMVEIAREVFKKKGYTIDYDVMNWARVLSDVKIGEYDAVIGASRADVREFVIPQVPTGILVNYFWALKDSRWSYKDEGSLDYVSVGTVNDYSYGDEIDKLVKKKHKSIKEVSGESPLLRLIQMTESGRLMAFVENPLVLGYNMKKLNKDKKIFKAVSKNLANDPDLFIAFSPSNPKSKEYAKILDEGMEELRKSGKLKEILLRYGLSDWAG
ncbi:hypothetical protein C0V70_08750 [Bacteriovorax stolpii]|uniref:Uncharacterized protein n=1 Tax=Bacteriovorax stolpii TaxID=960 RepID=A0A2K9NRP9_BACTC|nr:transporter substrate-binding domain-containing protein [Bacteriovorax stolpii]AUN98193.1 hypothetical protein C0V70_08750 [Bacteriovorax stolpii]TDP52111.1 amino acid ABC transporter substrate-binding protein (PAAT family) [Bacteriovorax stolpii]